MMGVTERLNDSIGMAQISWRKNNCKHCLEWWKTLIYIRDGVNYFDTVQEVFSDEKHDHQDLK